MRCPCYTQQLEHLTMLARSDLQGWKRYAWDRAKELEANSTGLWTGLCHDLTAAVNGTAMASESGRQPQTKPR